MEENQIGIIYRSFDELIKEHRGLFKLFNKTKNPGLLKAIWNARELEIKFLKQRLAQVERSNQARRIWKLTANLLKKKVNNLSSSLAILKFEHQQLKKESQNYKNEFLRYRRFSQSLENALKTISGENYDEKTQKESLSSQLAMVNHTLLATDRENHELKEKIAELQEKLFDLQDQLKWELSKNKQYFKINKQMENELFRLSSEIEQQNLLN